MGPIVCCHLEVSWIIHKDVRFGLLNWLFQRLWIYCQHYQDGQLDQSTRGATWPIFKDQVGYGAYISWLKVSIDHPHDFYRRCLQDRFQREDLPAKLASMSLEPQGEAIKYGFKERVHRFYRGTLFQAIIIGLVSFTQPGIWTALNSKGSHQLFYCILISIPRSRWWWRSKSHLRQSVKCHHLRVSTLLPRNTIKLIVSELWFSAPLFAVSLVIWLEWSGCLSLEQLVTFLTQPRSTATAFSARNGSSYSVPQHAAFLQQLCGHLKPR